MTDDRDERIAAMLRAGYEAYNRRDFIESTWFFHPDVVVVPAGGQPPIRSRPKVRSWMEPDAFREQILDVSEVTVNGDKAIVRARSHARGAGSGIELEFDTWTVWTFDAEERATRIEIFLGHDGLAARRAAGLPD